ncbi:MAG: helix-turn-helix domain-containing protein [Saccharofermentans sp.]|nr:helix-turn-helix domain-containing protein [Saccharofermentans sp.]
MKDKELRKLIGSRAKQRRIELGLNMQYVAERMGVNKSTIQRYEAGSIDNTKRLVVEGLSNILHVSPEWLRGETEEFVSDVSDDRDLRIRDLFGNITCIDQDNLSEEEFSFMRDVLIYILREYELFTESFKFGCENHKANIKYKELAKIAGLASVKEFNEVMFLREMTPMINALNNTAEALRVYSKDADRGYRDLRNLMNFVEPSEE